METVSAYDLKRRLDLSREPQTDSSFARALRILFGKSGWEIAE